MAPRSPEFRAHFAPEEFDVDELDEDGDEDEVPEGGDNDESLDTMIARSGISEREAREAFRRAMYEADQIDAEILATTLRGHKAPADGGSGSLAGTSGAGSGILAAGALAAMSGTELVARKSMHASSGFLTRVEKWGKGLIDKSVPWVKHIPFIGSFFAGDVVPSMGDREAKEQKAKADMVKQMGATRAEAAREMDKRAQEASVALNRALLEQKRQTEFTDRKDQQTAREREKALLALALPAERFAITHGTPEERAEMFAKIERDKDVRLARRRVHEYDQMLRLYMTKEEQEAFGKEILDSDPDRENKVAQKDRLRQLVISEINLPARQALAERTKGGQGKKKKGGS